MHPQRHLLLLIGIAILFASCATTYLTSGREAMDQYRYNDAITNFEKGLKKLPNTDDQLLLAEAYMKVNRFSEAKKYYALAMSNPDVTDDQRKDYGRALMTTGDYDAAKDVFAGIVSRKPNDQVAKNLEYSCRKIANLKQDSARFNLKVEPIKNMANAFSPKPYKDGILFTGQLENATLSEPYTGNGYIDLYYLEKKEDGTWKNPQAMSEFNTKFHDGIATVNADETRMIFTRSLVDDKNKLITDSAEVNNTQLFYSEKLPSGEWGEAKLWPFNETAHMVAHPALTPDGNTVFFASDIPGTNGEMDLYYSDKNGEFWTSPTNLGTDINTTGNELFPYAKSADTLFFSSDGHKSVGGLDVLYSVKKDGKWGKPQHLSYPLNSAYDDFGIAYLDNGNEGYISSDRSGKDQIYTFEILPMPTIVEGSIRDENTKDAMADVEITLRNLDTGEETTTRSDENGFFNLNLDPDADYLIIAKQPGYFETSQRITTKTRKTEGRVPVRFSMEQLLADGTGDGSGSGSGNGDGSGNDNGTGSGSGNGDGSGNDNGTGSGSGNGDGSGNDNATGSGSGNGDGSGNDNGTGSGSGTGSNSGDGDGDFDSTGDNLYKIPNIYWGFDKAEVRKESEEYLNMLVKKLKDNPAMRVELRSHCDSRGPAIYNIDLSQRRANAAKKYMVSKGVAASRIDAIGRGEEELANECADGVKCTAAQHQVNRRTEFRIISRD